MTLEFEIPLTRTARAAVRVRPLAVLGALAFLLCLLVIASPASAAPVHSPLPDLTLSGFNKACGAAVDSEGDLYVSSAGDSVVKVFDPEHNELTSISNANEPCGLAVDSKGNVYVSESESGDILKYALTSSYPFAGTPTYSSPTAIDLSGEARGIAVDPTEDRLYVARGDRIVVYEPNGSLAATVGLGQLTDADGVAAYTSANGDRFVFAADSSTDEIRVFGGTNVATLSLRHTIDGSDQDELTADKTPGNGFGFGPAGASPAVDQTNGHLFVYDDEHEVVDEFEASGPYITQIFDPDFEDAEPTGIAIFPQRNEIQRLKVEATGGAYTLSFEGETTSPLAYNATAAQVETALESLVAIGEEDLAVSGGYSNAFSSGTYNIAFAGALGDRNVGQLVTDASGLTGGSGAATITTEVQGSGPGRVYVTAGAGPGAQVLAFAALPPAGRPPLPSPRSFKLENACGVAVDSHGNRYVAADASIGVYPPNGATPLTTIADPGHPCDLAVDSTGHVYALDRGEAASGDEKAVYYTPGVFPPAGGTKYSGPTTVATASDFPPAGDPTLTSIAVNPGEGGKDHVFVSQRNHTIELDSADSGSGVLDPAWGAGLGIPRIDLAVYGENGDVYVAGGSAVYVINPLGTEILARTGGAGSPKGPFGSLGGLASIAVDQANGHFVLFVGDRGVVEEYEASGAFVAEFGSFQKGLSRPAGMAVDNSGGASDRSVYLAFFEDLSAFGPLAYGEPPLAVTGTASKVGSGGATLNGTVDPRGVVLEECRFEYTDEADFQANQFGNAEVASCVPGPAGIGAGAIPVAVHADVSGLDTDQRYRFRLVAENKYGVSEGVAGLFGPPLLTIEAPEPISFREATVRATIDPSGLPVVYRVEYGTTSAYGQTTESSLPPSAGPTEVEVPLFGLMEGTTYHFRVVAENDAKVVEGPDQTLTTLERTEKPACANDDFRTGRSASLPDCRAYELVTPADTRGATPYATDHSSTHQFNDWLVTPRGEAAGGSLAFFIDGTLPGFEGNGRRDGYRAVRTKTEGPHPAQGWKSELTGPSYAEAGGDQPAQQGVASDQQYWFWEVQPTEALSGTLDKGSYLRTPAGFEPVGRGSLGTDLKADGRFVTAGAVHVIFESDAQLEPGAPAKGTTGLYDRAAGGSTHVVSLEPDGTSFGPGEDASYVGATEDGSAIVFEVGGALFLRREGGQTVEVAAAPNTFAGLSDDGKRVFYTSAGNGAAPGNLFRFDAIEETATPITGDAIFVNVPADGSHVYLTSEESLDEAGKGTLGANNLYAWDGAGIRFIALLDPQDLTDFGGDSNINLLHWTDAVGPSAGPFVGRASSPTRSTPDGAVLVFQSHANLTPYDAEGHSQIYRYDAATQSILCASCDPAGSPPGGDATLQSTSGGGSTVAASTLIPNVTDDGQTVFFQSVDPLLPEDANDVQDVYEWKAQGSGSCKPQRGCLALISSGQGETDNYLYSMTPDGHDVFFTTLEKLVEADVTGSPSIYDARVEGGIPSPPAKAPCQADACQGQGSPPPTLGAPASARFGAPKHHCPKGRRRVVRHGKARCVKKHRKKHRSAKRRASR